MSWFSDRVDELDTGLGYVTHAAGEAYDSVVKTAGDGVRDGMHLASEGLDAIGQHDAAKAVDQGGDWVANETGNDVATKELGQTEDPKELIHGDAEALHDLAKTLTKLGQAADEAAGGLAKIDTSHWQGDAANNFRGVYSQHPKAWSTVSSAMTTAANATNTYAESITWGQNQAQQAIDLYKKAEADQQRVTAEYQAQVNDYNGKVDAANAALQAGQKPTPPGAPPAQPGDPGAEGKAKARDLLNHARQQVQQANTAAAGALKSVTGQLPETPSVSEQRRMEFEDGVKTQLTGAEHLVGGVAKGLGGIVKFTRQLNPIDLYNLQHPDEYVEGVNTTVVGLVHGIHHPKELIKGIVGTGWGRDPLDAGGNLGGQLIPDVLSGGAGAAATVGGLGRRALTGAERGAAHAAEDTAEGAAHTAANAGRRGPHDVEPSTTHDLPPGKPNEGPAPTGGPTTPPKPGPQHLPGGGAGELTGDAFGSAGNAISGVEKQLDGIAAHDAAPVTRDVADANTHMSSAEQHLDDINVREPAHASTGSGSPPSGGGGSYGGGPHGGGSSEPPAGSGGSSGGGGGGKPPVDPPTGGKPAGSSDGGRRGFDSDANEHLARAEKSLDGIKTKEPSGGGGSSISDVLGGGKANKAPTINMRSIDEVRDFGPDAARRSSSTRHEPKATREDFEQMREHFPEADYQQNLAAVEKFQAANPRYAHIDPDCLVAIRGYTGHSHFEGLNASLRTSDPEALARWQGYKHALEDGLQEMPIHQGPVVRGVSGLTEDEIARYVPNQDVIEPSFLSTDARKSFNGDTQFEIYSNTGRDISKLSRVARENEVLFAPDTKFHVLENEVRGGVRYIRMVERPD